MPASASRTPSRWSCRSATAELAADIASRAHPSLLRCLQGRDARMPAPQVRPPLRRAARQAAGDAAGDWRGAPRRPTRGNVRPCRDNAPPGVGHSVSRSLHLRVSWWRAELPRGCDIVEQLASMQSEIAVGDRSPMQNTRALLVHVIKPMREQSPKQAIQPVNVGAQAPGHR